MSEFRINHGSVAMCRFDLETLSCVLHGNAPKANGGLLIREDTRYSFTLDHPDSRLEYRVFIGDMPVSDMLPYGAASGGVSINEQLIWPDWAYFESGRGETYVTIETKGGSASEEWRVLLQIPVYVSPTKMGEVAYERMAEDLQTLNRSLLVDLYGKSTKTYEVRFAKEMRRFHSKEEELESIAALVERLSTICECIMCRPSSRIERKPVRIKYWGTERLAPRSLAALCRIGISPAGAPRPVSIIQSKCTETFDIPEHQVLKWFLELLQSRVDICCRAAKQHVKSIEGERHLRDFKFGSSPSLYEAIDVPKINRLKKAVMKAAQLRQQVAAMQSLYFLRNVKGQLSSFKGGSFQRSSEYRELYRLILDFVNSTATWFEGLDFAAVTKLTSRLFEQWCFLQIVDSFRKAGVEIGNWSDAFQQETRAKFILDFDRGLQFEGFAAAGFKLRLRYEPWILGEKTAQKKNESLCRGSADGVAWCPDIVIEFMRQENEAWEPVYAIVLDCKYTTSVKDQHWNDTRKYLQIRSTRGKGQVVRQLWIISLGSRGPITSLDPAVIFDEAGPSCPIAETVSFTMGVDLVSSVQEATEASGNPSVFVRFAAGIMNYARRKLI